jgi:hypothetical protein
MAAKRRSQRLPQILFSPLKTSGICSAKPKKKERKCAQISRKVRSWWNFTTPLEPILRKSAKKHKPRRLAGKSARCAPPEKPFALFLRFPPPRFFGFGKGCFWWCAVALATWRFY